MAASASPPDHSVPTGTTRRLAGIDAARLSLAFMVVLAHCASFQAVGPWAHFAFNNGLARVIVPFFLLTTGFFFDRQMAHGLGPWMWRVGRIYLLWTAIYLPFLLFYQEVSVYRLSLTLAFGFFHLWYLPALIGGMAVLYWVRNLRDGWLMTLATGAFVIGAMVQYAENMWLDLSRFVSPYDLLVLTRNFLLYGFPYLALGLLIQRGRLLANMSRPRRLIWLAGSVLLMTAEVTAEYHALDPDGFFDLTVTAFLVTPVLFVTVRDLRIRPLGFDPRRMSMLIYLSHPLYLLPLRELTGAGPMALTVMTLAATLGMAPLWLRLNRFVRILP